MSEECRYAYAFGGDGCEHGSEDDTLEELEKQLAEQLQEDLG